ncbi:hypothetical protein H2200_006873 [Cladophialophora chaetospira]|uniref:Tyrosyl-DNA phosphodiesterase n=1 Tax=Cladophialophora chaetospira TaxID=386627 RepID=A0AA39CHL4_9EURO|nr:hypothetical protein H2200_006873 [Cladophialophora chaetospira]
MAPEIVDLISDDEDEIDVPGPSTSTNRAPQRRAISNGTINPAILSYRKTPDMPKYETTGSRASCHTERSSADPSLSPLFVPIASPSPEDKGKGKGRASPIPEIDLSHDTDDDGNHGPIDETWDYANGEFTEEDALKQAIALSLQEQTPTKVDEQDHVRAGASSSTPPGNHASLGTVPLPNWHASPTKVSSNAVSGCAGNSQPSASPLHAQDQTAAVNTGTETALPPNAEDQKTAATTKTKTASPAVQDTTTSKEADNAEQKPASNTFSLTGLDRKQMEAERLARLKRKHAGTREEDEQPNSKVVKTAPVQLEARRDKTVSPPPLRSRRQDTDTSSDQRAVRPSVTELTSRPAENDTAQARTTTSSNTVSLDDDDDEDTPAPTFYPDGVALKTHVPGYPNARTISFPSLISPSSHLDSALLSSFIWNFDWLFPHFETRRTKFQLIMHAKTPAERENIKRDWAGVPNVRLTFPPMEGNVNCMHSKLMLLFYKNEEEAVWKGGQRCRIVVPTANLMDFDWGVGGFMENMVWLIDLPLKSATMATETPFQKSLKQFLKAQTVPEDVLRKLDEFDFSKTAKYGFVHTIGGMHSGQTWRTTGLCGLGRVVTALGLASKEIIQLDYVTSSVGSLNDEFMSSMYLAAQGDDGLTEYARRVKKKAPISKRLDSWKENFRLYFPSDNTVRTSKAGPHRAGTICFSTKWWQNSKFPRANMLDCISIRERLLMHNKLLFVRYPSPIETPQSSSIGWSYIGSANLSESAWGRLVQDKVTKEPRLNCRNWECGVIIPILVKSSDSRGSAVTSHRDEGLAAFEGRVPVPMRFPSEDMDQKKPWMIYNG